MAQVSYGTITITDTTDINKIENWYLATDLSSGVTRDNPASGHGTWSTSIQSMDASFQYLWNYEKIYGTGLNNTDVLISQTDPVIIGRYGQNGTNGVDGNSITSIDEYYQVTNSTTNPGSSGWQKNTLVTPTSTNKYLWNYQVINYSKTAAEGSYTDARIIGVYGDTGPQGPQGNPGTNGINTATVYLYQRAASTPSKPNSTLTYTFSTSTLSGTLGSWKQSIGELSGTNPIWVIAAVASSNGTTDTITNSEWSTQIKLAENGTNGTNGLNQATIFIYKRATSATAPSSTTYTFSSGSFTVPNGWSKTIPASNGYPCYVTSAVAIGNGTTATLTWNTPSILVEDGSDGISPTVTSTSNGVKIVDADGNETYITNGTNGTSYYTFVRYSANANGSNYQPTPDVSRPYIGVYSGTESSPPAYNNSGWTWSKYLGTDGTPGVDGISVTAVKEIYYLTTGNAPTAPSAGITTTSTSTGTDVWTTVVPTYVPNGKYYTSIQTTLSKSTSPISSTAILNNALTDESYRAWEALSISQNANENAQGAMAQAAEAQYQAEALDTKLKNFFWPGDDDYPGAYAVGKGSSDGLNVEDISTYGYNVRLTPATISIGYNEVNAILIDGSNPTLKFYPPSKTARNPDNPTMELTSSALKFYRPGTTTVDAQLDSGGLKITNGSIVLGTTNGTTAGNITLSNTDFSRSINETSRSNLRLAIGGNFGVKNDGTLYASNADISGVLTAGASSKIGPWNVTNSSIWYGNSTFGNTNGIYLGTEGLSLGSAFQVTNTGIVTANNITATGGKIGGWTIAGQKIYAGDGSTIKTAVMQAPSSSVTWVFAAGGSSHDSYNDCPFRVDKTGALYATSGSIGGWNVSSTALCSATTYTPASSRILLAPAGVTTSSATGNLPAATYAITAGTNFGVTTAGTMYATGANILTATIGNASNKITIGTGTSGHSSVRYGMTTLTDTTNNGFYIGTDGIALGGGKFKVTAAGVITATGFATTSEVQTASEQASKYILPVTTQDNSSGIQVHTEGNTESFVQIVPGEIAIYTNGESGTISALSLTSEDITIGDESSTHIVITADSLSFLKDSETTIMSMDSTETSFKMGGYTWVANEDRLTLWS